MNRNLLLNIFRIVISLVTIWITTIVGYETVVTVLLALIYLEQNDNKNKP